MSDKPTIVTLAPKDEFMAAVEQTKRDMPARLEYITLQAKLRRAIYDAMLLEGFTEEQAFDACLEDT